MPIRSLLTRSALGAIAAAALMMPSVSSADVLADAQAKLPAKVREAKAFDAVATFSWPPFAFLEAQDQPAGLDIDLLSAIAERLGVKAGFTTSKVAAISTLNSGRSDMALGQLGITKSRLDAADFVPYLKSGWRLLVRAGDTEKFSAENLCGLTLSATQGTSQVAIIQEVSKVCEADGKPAIILQEYPNTPASFLALENGRGDGYLVSEAVSVYLQSTSTSLKIAPGSIVEPTIYSGFGLRKGEADFAEALTLALEAMYDDGSYQAIFEKYGIPGAALTREQLRTAPADLALDQ